MRTLSGQTYDLIRTLARGKSGTALTRKQVRWIRDVAGREHAADSSVRGTIFYEDGGIIAKDENGALDAKLRVWPNGAGVASWHEPEKQTSSPDPGCR